LIWDGAGASKPQTMQRKTFLYWRILVTICSLLVLFAHQDTLAARNEADEYQAKMALLFNFAKLATWPPEAFTNGDSTFVFAILGPNPFGTALELIRGKSMHGRSIEISQYNSVAEFQSCQVLFSSPDSLNELRQKYPTRFAKGHPLTVGQVDGFARMGGILHLTFVEDHLAFLVNLSAARRAQIEISASLLNLAVEVIED
jgi:hypothetical protein